MCYTINRKTWQGEGDLALRQRCRLTHWGPAPVRHAKFHGDRAMFENF